MEKTYKIEPSFSYRIIYVYSIPLETHGGLLKIGSASITSVTEPSQREIDDAAHTRIIQQTKTAMVPYNFLHAELAITDANESFSDYSVHEVLRRSGFERISRNIKNQHSEWFEIDLDIAKNAIKAVREGRSALNNTEINQQANISTFEFRPNQLDAIEKTIQAINSKKKEYLWNAKMRFGKTTAALQVAKEKEMEKILITTHRPSVHEDWKKDFFKVFGDNNNYKFSSRDEGEKIKKLISDNSKFVYFASLQDLRGSSVVIQIENSGSNAKGFDKNEEIFETTWDILIIDEAHEGTQSSLGDTTVNKINSNFTLHLSGTPFNLLHRHEENNIYTWDYVMEQEAKLNWDDEFPGRPNPYEELPELNIFTYDIDTLKQGLGELDEGLIDLEDGAFKFHEFFRVQKDEIGNDIAEFVHKDKVNKFLDLLVDNNLKTKFPYATEEYRDYNKHSLWLLPNRVKVIEAMEGLLREHEVFKNFGIVNISGDAKYDDDDKDAKDSVTKAINENEYTITLTGQRLTTGASVPEWTAVFMMSDTSSATAYLQTAFRCQTPANIDGKMKTKGYVFDFAPDRTLKLIAEVIELNHKSGKTNTPEQKEAMQKFLNFCPIISSKNGLMRTYDVGEMLGQLKKAIIQRVANNGFDDPKLYNDELLKLDDIELEKFSRLRKIVGQSTKEKINEININNLGLDNELIENAEKIERKRKDLTDEEKEALKKLKEAREQRKTAISVLRGVSIRMPMLVYGSELPMSSDIDLNTFINDVDEDSWKEFMPAGLSKEEFREFTKYYDEDVFKGVTKNIRLKAKDCDNLLPAERVAAISSLFSTFKNPDKETVLTPWNVVNLHMNLAFGGSDFRYEINGKPDWVTKDVDTKIWDEERNKVLEINSKSGLYPLLAAYNFYNRRLKNVKGNKSEELIHKELWTKVLKENIYVICKTPMAKSITRRTLAGHNKNTDTNIIYIEDLVRKLQKKEEYKDYNLKYDLHEKFSLEEDNMKFSAIVGNPPYQENIKGRGDQPSIYNFFIDAAYELSDLVSLIHPARFLFNAGSTSKAWNEKMLNDPHLKILLFEQDSSKLFPNTDIKGGVVISLRDKNIITSGLGGSFFHHNELRLIVDKVKKISFKPISNLVQANTSYKYSKSIYEDNPYLRARVSGGSVRYLSSSVFDKFKEIMYKSIPSDGNSYAEIYGRVNSKRVVRFINLKYIDPPENFMKYKVLLPASNGSGELGEVVSSPFVTGPGVGHTETFISIGNFETKQESENLLKYIKTKFLRILLSSLKITQSNKSKLVWSNIPLQDFSEDSNIDWNKSISDIDKQLYEKYKLDLKEIDFIEKNVKPMN
jgi:superfamily II DNA or RNA helicase